MSRIPLDGRRYIVDMVREFAIDEATDGGPATKWLEAPSIAMRGGKAEALERLDP
jgi:hypothetical protein